MPLSEAEKWLDHLGSCSPCYSDFSAFRAAYQRYRTRSVLAIAASILIVAILAGWVLFLREKQPLVAQTAVLDLRDRSISRGTEVNPAEPPLEISRRVSHLKIYLPVGSSEGDYDLRITALSGEEVLAATGTAKQSNGITCLGIALHVGFLPEGKYLLQIRRPYRGWESHPLVLR